MEHNNELSTIGSLTPEDLSEIEAKLDSTGAQINSPAQLVALTAEVTNVNVNVSAALIGQLLQVHQISGRIGVSLDELFQQRALSLAGLEDGESQLLGVANLRRLANSTAIKLAARAIDLTYDCDNLLQRSRILTDVRPIFSDNASSIEGAIVAHTLRLRYDTAGRNEELSLALDSADLRRLILDCERALLKEQISREQLIKKADVSSPSLPEDTQND